MTIKELEQRIFSIPPHVDSEQMVVVLGYNDYQELDQEVKMQATYPNHVQQDHLIEPVERFGKSIRKILRT